jgi:hypothetical protein
VSGALLLVQYVGFQSKPLGREYRFRVREAQDTPREFTLMITNEAFDSRSVRFQDAPDVCSLKLHRELAASENHPATTEFEISAVDLAEYRLAHTRKSTRYPNQRKTEQEY